MMGPPISASGTTLKQLSVLPAAVPEAAPAAVGAAQQRAHDPLGRPQRHQRQLHLRDRPGAEAEDRGLHGGVRGQRLAERRRVQVRLGRRDSHRGMSSGRVVHIVDPSLSHCNPDLARRVPAVPVGLLQAVRLHRDPGPAGRDAAHGRRRHGGAAPGAGHARSSAPSRRSSRS